LERHVAEPSPAPGRQKSGAKPAKRIDSQSALNSAVWSICDVMRRSNCAGALQYVPELTWILFLRILDVREEHEAEAAEAVGIKFRPSLGPPFRWRDWAAPEATERKKLQESRPNAFYDFVNGELIPRLKKLKAHPNATPRQKIISEIMSGVDRTRIDTERNLCDVLDKVNDIRPEQVDQTHLFTLSQIYEGLLLKMGEKGNDGGQFFTPREIIRAMVEVVAPKPGETLYDPCCGTGGFLAQACEYLLAKLGDQATGEEIEQIKRRSFFGREKENLVYPIALANLILHGIDEPRIWHGNTLTRAESYSGLFENVPSTFDVVLTNPPFGGKEGADAQTRFAYKTRATQVLFLQDVIQSLSPRGRCGIVMDEGLLFQTTQAAFVQTKRRLLDTCNLWCIVSLPAGVFSAAGAGVKANLLFFEKGGPAENIWYYDLSDVKVGKKRPFTREKLADFFRLLPSRGSSDRSWTVDIAARRRAASEEAVNIRTTASGARAELKLLEAKLAALKSSRGEGEVESVRQKIRELEKQIRAIEARAQQVEDAAFDLKAVNPRAKANEDTRSAAELLSLAEAKGRQVEEALARLRRLLV
jgi:type I restriction enzyme M protein